ncbi:MAG: OstA-like protein [Bacteroidales bacterium]
MQRHTPILFFLIITFGLCSGPLRAQKRERVKLIKADAARYDQKLGENVQRLIGNVALKHDSTLLYCDSAWLDESDNSFTGFGHVWIKASDTLDLWGNYLEYNGNDKIAEMEGNVILRDKRGSLLTEHLTYDRTRKLAFYKTGGKIIDTANTLTSRIGYYNTDQQMAWFKEDVVLENEKYTIYTDTLQYHTASEFAWFHGPTVIESDENTIYCERGWYDTRNGKSKFAQNTRMSTAEQILYADTLFYDRSSDFGIARSRIRLIDTVQDMSVQGNYGEFRREAGNAFVTGKAIATLADDQDTLFLHSDTLWMEFDTLQELKQLLAYHKVKFYRKDLQGMSDSLVYKLADSTIFLYLNPVLWSGSNQLSSDSIHIFMQNKKLDTIALMGHAFIISVDDTVSMSTYNQIKGKIMVGRFKDNMLRRIDVYGNAETVYYIRDEDLSLLGINVAFSSDLWIALEDNDVVTISFIREPDAQTYAPGKLPEEYKRLKDFKWLEDRRPATKDDIFFW